MDAISDRLRPNQISDEDLQVFSDLCDEIEDRATRGDDGQLPRLLALWNERAGIEYKLLDFTSYYQSIDKEDFVRRALYGRPPIVPDLSFDEACALVRAISSVELTESENAYFLEFLEQNLPNSWLTDLMYWPNEWFEDAVQLQVELSAEEIIGYAMIRSGRKLKGTPGTLDLPYPVPRRDGRDV